MSVIRVKISGIGQSAAKSKRKRFLVYKITNAVNNKSYIGITGRSLAARLDEHVYYMRNQVNYFGTRLYPAVKKYGLENFTVEIIDETFSEEEIRHLETFYITKFNTYENGYNCNLGGHGFLRFPDHIKKKISESQKGKVISQECRSKMSAAKKGDKRCAKHFGSFTLKGANNPRSKSWLIRFPNNEVWLICGVGEFCRKQNLSYSSLRDYGKTQGFTLLERFNDYPVREYTQASGSSGNPQF